MASVAPQEIVFSTRFRIEGSDGKFRFSNVKRASSLDKDVPVGIYTEDGDVHTRQQSSNTKKDLATTFKDGQTTHVETTTTVTVKSITHPTNASEKKSVSSRQPLGVSDSAIWVLKVVDVIKGTYIIEVDGGLVGEVDDRLYAFYDERDRHQAKQWRIELHEDKTLKLRNAVKGRTLPFFRIFDIDNARQWAMNPVSPYIFTAPVEAYTYYISQKVSPTETGYVTYGPGIPEGPEYQATLQEDKNTCTIQQVGCGFVIQINGHYAVEHDDKLWASNVASLENATRWAIVSREGVPLELGSIVDAFVYKVEHTNSPPLAWQPAGTDKQISVLPLGFNPDSQIFHFDPEVHIED